MLQNGFEVDRSVVVVSRGVVQILSVDKQTDPRLMNHKLRHFTSLFFHLKKVTARNRAYYRLPNSKG